MRIPSLKMILTWILMAPLILCSNLMLLARLLYGRLTVGSSFFTVKPRPTPPPILTDPKWGTHGYMQLKSQGVRLHYVEAGNRERPLMLLVHGFPECWFSWRHQLQYFADKYWVVAVDMRGYADSDKPSDISDYAIGHLIEDMRQFVLALGKKQCILCAHDWGGAIAWQLVSKFPEMFQCHISCNGPHPVAYNKQLHKSFKQLTMSWYVFFFQMPWIPEIMLRTQDLNLFNEAFRGPKNNVKAYPDEVLEAYKYYFSREGAFTPPLNYYRNIWFSEQVKLAKVTVPTLILWGDQDIALEKPMAALCADECEKVELHYLEGTSHWVQQDEPLKVNKLIEDFLGRHL